MHEEESDKVRVIAIAAMDEARVIGNENTIPWKIKGEQKYFATVTKGHTVLMGRKTYDSLPAQSRPLPDRLNVVASRSVSIPTGSPQVNFITEPRRYVQSCRAGEEQIRGSILWVIGGAEIYLQTADLWDELYLTLIRGTHPGDAFFPDILNDFELVSEEDLHTHSYQRYRRCRELT